MNRRRRAALMCTTAAVLGIWIIGYRWGFPFAAAGWAFVYGILVGLLEAPNVFPAKEEADHG